MANQAFYDRIGALVPGEGDLEVNASLVLISGCQDFQASVDLGFNGLFTWKLKQVWNEGRFAGDYSEFHKKIGKGVSEVNPEQAPNLLTGGSPGTSFVGEKPYALGE